MTLSISSLFGQSLSALSLSNPVELAGIAAGAGALAVMATAAAVAVVHKKWEDYKESEHKARVEEVNKIYKDRLERIESPDGTFLSGFPIIFKLSADGKSVDSLHYNVDEIKKIGVNPPHIDAALASYREDILDAIRGLKEYYLCRGPKKYNDITAGVISYLLNMLENKCLSFEGYNNDIAYLNALTRFIQDYASLKKSKETQHFSRLGPIYSSLESAVQKLEKHQKSLPLRGLVDELRETIIYNSDRLLRLFSKMVIPTDDAYLGDLVTYNHLQQGVLRGQYIRSETGGKVVWSWDREIDLPAGIFQRWIKGLAKYYKQSLNPSSILRDNNTLQPTELYQFTIWAQSVLKQSKPSKADKAKLKQELDLIRAVFKHSPDFINTKLAGTEKDPEFISVTDDVEVIQRTIYMADFAHLIHASISLQAFCAHLVNSIDELGSIYINDPNHFNKIFAKLEALCNLAKSDIDKNRQNFLQIKEDNKNQMRLSKEGVFPDDVEQVFKAMDHMLTNLGQQVIDYKSHHSESAKEATKAAVNDMLTVAQFFTNMYVLDDSKPAKSPSFSDDSQPTSSTSAGKPPAIEKQGNPVALPSTDIPLVPITETQDDPETRLNELGAAINDKITGIKRQKPLDPHFAKYQMIYSTLRALQIKSIAMLEENGQDFTRIDKANKTCELTLSLFNTTLQFLSLPPADRKKQARTFIQQIHDELNNPENSEFIDRHRDGHGLFKFIYENLGFFPTKTRERLSDVEHAYESLNSTALVSA